MYNEYTKQLACRPTAKQLLLLLLFICIRYNKNTIAYNKNATVSPGIKSYHKPPQKIIKNRVFVQASGHN